MGVGKARRGVAEPREVGVFGGSFDPPHVGHLIVAREALERLGLDEVRFVPAHRSPFKTEAATSPVEARVAMMERAIEDDPGFVVSTVEADRDPPSFMVDTLRELRSSEPEVSWTLLIGADQWASFDGWKSPREIGELARIAVMSRDGVQPKDAEPVPELPWIEVPVSRIDISSSSVRARVATGRSVRHMIPDAVRAFIESNGLYSSC